MTELKFCPFCRGENIEPDYINTPYGMQCQDCGASGPPESTQDPDEAIEAWNTRALPRVKPLVWEAPNRRNNWVYIAQSPFGNYGIHIEGGRHMAWLETHTHPYEVWINEDPVGSVFEAQTLAQADYERRILEALE